MILITENSILEFRKKVLLSLWKSRWFLIVASKLKKHWNKSKQGNISRKSFLITSFDYKIFLELVVFIKKQEGNFYARWNGKRFMIDFKQSCFIPYSFRFFSSARKIWISGEFSHRTLNCCDEFFRSFGTALPETECHRFTKLIHNSPVSTAKQPQISTQFKESTDFRYWNLTKCLKRHVLFQWIFF